MNRLPVRAVQSEARGGGGGGGRGGGGRGRNGEEGNGRIERLLTG